MYKTLTPAQLTPLSLTDNRQRVENANTLEAFYSLPYDLLSDRRCASRDDEGLPSETMLIEYDVEQDEETEGSEQHKEYGGQRWCIYG